MMIVLLQLFAVAAAIGRPQIIPESQTGCNNPRFIQCSNTFAQQLGVEGITAQDADILLALDSVLERDDMEGLKRVCKYADEFSMCIDNQFEPCFAFDNLRQLDVMFSDSVGFRGIVSAFMQECMSMSGAMDSDFSCAGRSNGLYIKDGQECSRDHVVCVDYQAFRMMCPPQQTVTDAQLCRPLKDVPRCAGRLPPPPMPEPQMAPVECPARVGLLPNPEKRCSMLFLTCLLGKYNLRSCRAGYFDPQDSQCKPIEQVPDCADMIPTAEKFIPPPQPQIAPQRVSAASLAQPAPPKIQTPPQVPQITPPQAPPRRVSAASLAQPAPPKVQAPPQPLPIVRPVVQPQQPQPPVQRLNLPTNTVPVGTDFQVLTMPEVMPSSPTGCDNQRLMKCAESMMMNLGLSGFSSAGDLLSMLTGILRQERTDGLNRICDAGDQFSTCINAQFKPCFSTENLRSLTGVYSDVMQWQRLMADLYEQCWVVFRQRSTFDCHGQNDGIYVNQATPCGREHISCMHQQMFAGVCPPGHSIDTDSLQCAPLSRLERCQFQTEPVAPEPLSPPAPIERPVVQPPPLPIKRPVIIPQAPPAPQVGEPVAPQLPVAPVAPVKQPLPEASESSEYAMPKDFNPPAPVQEPVVQAPPPQRPINKLLPRPIITQPLVPELPPTPAQPQQPDSYGQPKIPLSPEIPKEMEFDCIGREDGDYPNPKVQCSQFYISCVDDQLLWRACPAELKFEPSAGPLGECRPEGEAPVCGGVLPPVTEPTVAAPITTTVHPIFNCQDLEDGNYPDPRAHCSEVFFSCVGGNTVDRLCPVDQFYSAELDECDLAIYITQCGGQPRPVTEPTTLAPPRDEPILFDCQDLPEGNYPDPSHPCSNVYYACVGKRGGVLRECGDETFYDAELDMCVRFEQHPFCSGTPRTPPPQTTTFAPAPPRIPEVQFNCPGEGNFPDPHVKCAYRYIACAGPNTFPEVIQCPLGTFYDPEIDECGRFKEVPVCGGVRPEVTTPATAAAPSALPVDCSTRPDGFYAPQDRPCPRFFVQCRHQEGVRVACPDGLAFSEPEQYCVDPAHVPTCLEDFAHP